MILRRKQLIRQRFCSLSCAKRLLYGLCCRVIVKLKDLAVTSTVQLQQYSVRNGPYGNQLHLSPPPVSSLPLPRSTIDEDAWRWSSRKQQFCLVILCTVRAETPRDAMVVADSRKTMMRLPLALHCHSVDGLLKPSYPWRYL